MARKKKTYKWHIVTKDKSKDIEYEIIHKLFSSLSGTLTKANFFKVGTTSEMNISVHIKDNISLGEGQMQEAVLANMIPVFGGITVYEGGSLTLYSLMAEING